MSKDKPKLCPLLSTAPVEFNADCMRDRCAWFHIVDGDGVCAMLRIADRLDREKPVPKV